jgi:peptide chain release factor
MLLFTQLGLINMSMIYLQISTGRGPTECTVALHHLTRKLLAEGPGAMLVRSSYQSSILSFEGDRVEDYVRPYVGTILWVCDDPIRAHRKRKNWYLGVKMIDLPDPDIIVELRDDDLKWETMRASGPGGQAVNKGESSVRLTHRPTGVVTQSEDQRSQKQNRHIALERMRRALQDKHRIQMALLERINWNQHNEIERGNPIKTFIGPEFSELMIK